MDTAFALNLDDRAELTVVEAANLIWKWREHRNRAFWNALYVWGTVAIAIAIIPYIVPGLPARLGLAVLIFPCWPVSSRCSRLISRQCCIACISRWTGNTGSCSGVTIRRTCGLIRLSSAC